MLTTHLRWILLLTALFALTACDEEAPSDTRDASADMGEADAPSCDTVATPVEDLTLIQSPSNVLGYYIEWATPEAVESTVTVNCGGEPLASVNTSGTDHRTFVWGFYAGAECTAEVSIGGCEVASEELTVGELPEALPEITVTGDVEAVEPGWTLVNLVNAFDEPPMRVALIDAQGRIRWYHTIDTSFEGSDNEVALTSEGVLICGNRLQNAPTIVDWEGKTVWQQEGVNMHHDCRFIDDEERVLRYLDGSTEGCPEGIWADTIHELDRETGEELWQWRICEHVTPDERVQDWSHVNTIEPYPNEEAILISSRNQDSLYKVDRGTGEVAWRLGVNGDFAMDEADLFYQQHAPEIQPDGTIVLFDNGLAGVRESSRVLQLRYDESAMTAEVIWSFDPEPAIFAPIWGDADRLPGGNTLATFGQRSTERQTHIIEISPAGEELWRLSYALEWGSYRADRVPVPELGYAITP